MILLGNTFPLSLIRRSAVISPASLDKLRKRANAEGFLSYWGHDNTRHAARAILGFDPAPVTPRPALSLSCENLPTLDGHTFTEVWVLSPDYASGFRPGIGDEVTPEQIAGWQILTISFP